MSHVTLASLLTDYGVSDDPQAPTVNVEAPVVPEVAQVPGIEFERLPEAATSAIEDAYQRGLEEGRREGVLRDVPVATVFLMLAHGGGALFCLRPLAKQLGTPTRRSAATVRAQAEEIAETLVRGLERR